MQNAESLEAVYIYIYIVGFNKINLCKHRIKAMYFRRIKKSFKVHSFLYANLILDNQKYEYDK